jgi:hypothetical protein
VESRRPVSLDGASGENHAPDVLGSGSEREPRFTPAARRRLRLGSIVIIVSIAAVAAGLEVQERRDTAAEERRLAGLPQLSAAGPYGFGFEADPPPSLSGVLTMPVNLSNDGPRDVIVTHASAGGFVLLAPVPLPAQSTRHVVMRQNLQCSADTPPPTQPSGSESSVPKPVWPGPLLITAKTPRGTQTITLARPPYYTDHAAGVCESLRDGGPDRREERLLRHELGLLSSELLLR